MTDSGTGTHAKIPVG